MAQNIRSTKSIYRNDSHTNSMIGLMNQMRKDVLLCDLTLATSIIIMILAAASTYFYTIFTNSEDNLQNRVTLNGVNSQAMASILEYIYMSEVEITDENVQDILIAASLLQLTDLRDFCLQFLKNQLHSTNCLKIWTNVDLHDFQELLKNVEDFILENFSDVAKSEDFLQLPQEEISGIISKDKLKVPSEEKVFEFILTWIKHDLESRKQYLVSLMKNVRICYLPKEYIIETFLEEPLLKNDPQCQGFVIDAFKVCVSKEDAKTTIPRRKYQNSSKILLVAGDVISQNSVEYYDFVQKCWSKLVDMPIDRNGAGATVLRDKVYIAGGANENSVVIYDAASDRWIPSINMQFKRHRLGVATLKNCIYTVGGFSNGPLNTVEKLDHETKQWSTVAPLLTKRYGHGVGVVDDILYAVGGYDEGYDYLNSVESYNPTTNTWTYAKSLHSKKSGVGVGVLNGVLYAVGGRDGSSCFKSAEVFNPKTGNWTMIKDMQNCRNGAAVVTANDLLYVVGGHDGSEYLSSVEVYNPNTDTWTVLPSCMNIGRAWHCAAIIDKSS